MKFQETLPVHRIRLFAALSALSLLGITAWAVAQAPGQLTITSPRSGASVSAGHSLTITVTIGSGIFPKGVAVIAQDPLGNTDVQSVRGSTVTFTLPIPANTPSDSYDITAVGVDSTGALVSSAPLRKL
jgi:hypothetical protein